MSGAYPRDPIATPAEQELLDRYNAIMAAIRTIEAGEQLTGKPADAAKATLWREADAIQREAIALDAGGAS